MTSLFVRQAGNKKWKSAFSARFYPLLFSRKKLTLKIRECSNTIALAKRETETTDDLEKTHASSLIWCRPSAELVTMTF